MNPPVDRIILGLLTGILGHGAVTLGPVISNRDHGAVVLGPGPGTPGVPGTPDVPGGYEAGQENGGPVAECMCRSQCHLDSAGGLA